MKYRSIHATHYIYYCKIKYNNNKNNNMTTGATCNIIFTCYIIIHVLIEHSILHAELLYISGKFTIWIFIDVAIKAISGIKVSKQVQNHK